MEDVSRMGLNAPSTLQRYNIYLIFQQKIEKTFNMDAKNIQKLVEKTKDDILREVQDRLPRKVGVIAVNHFKQNFRDGGWMDDGLHPWKRTRRQEEDASPGTWLTHLLASMAKVPCPRICQTRQGCGSALPSPRRHTSRCRLTFHSVSSWATPRNCK